MTNRAAAIEGGFDPSDPQDYYPKRPESPEERAAFDSTPLGSALKRSTRDFRRSEFYHGHQAENRETRG